ncbi:MAG: ABC transporter ATP-binding protein [Clostridiales bacterium]|nr:ABC transporter ATP-binding protein [Clostridiales bacterium]
MILETENLSKSYQNKVAVNSINLSVEKGQIYGFLGPNGAGKSTTIKMLTGLVFPTSGKGQVLGRPLGDIRARIRLGYLPELFRFQEWMTGEDLLNFHTGLFRLRRDPERNRRVLNRVGLSGQEKYKVGGYSKGMQQRIGLACALLPDPELLFLDEPTSALDPVGRKDVRDIILALQKEGTTIFLNSHLLSEVEAVCDHVAIINKGSVVKSGAMKDLLMERVTLSVRCAPLPREVWRVILETFDGSATPQREDGSLTLALKDTEDIPVIAALLASHNIKLYELTPHRETLESVFLKVIGEGEQA